MKYKTKLEECSGRFDFCWPWFDKFTNGKDFGHPRSKGLSFQELTNIETNKKSRSLPILTYGRKKGQTLLLNFCPFCGFDYRKNRGQ